MYYEKKDTTNLLKHQEIDPRDNGKQGIYAINVKGIAQ